MPPKAFKYFIFLMIVSIPIVVTGCNDPAQPTIGCRPIELINAIVQANADKDHDHIILPENCDYELGNPLFEIPDAGYVPDFEYAGLPSITSPITITGNHSRIMRPDTPGTDLFRFFHVAKGGSLSLVELSFENGSVQEIGGAILVNGGTLSVNQCEFSNNSAIESGGAIATYELYSGGVFSTEIFIINSVFRNNTAGGGGAIHHRSGLLDIDFESLFESNQALNASGGAIVARGHSQAIYNSTIRNNHAYQRGGGIFSMGGTTTLQGVLIEDNTAEEGGGIHSYTGNLVIRGCQILNNQALLSGGLDLYAPNVTISDGTVIEGNIAAENAGGIGLDQNPTVIIEDSSINNNQSGEEGGGIGATGGLFYPTVTLNNSTVSGNSAAILGGGVYINSGEWQIHNSTISENTAAEGGGIYNRGDLLVTNSTISGNQADQGGGVLHSGNDDVYFSFVTVTENTAISGGGLEVDSARIMVTNSIVAGNSPQNCLGNIVPIHNNLDDDGSCAFNITGNPQLGPLADNGGPTQTHAIASFGPAMEVAVPCTATSMNISTPIDQDQRGLSRPKGVACDLGAYEANISLLVAPPMGACIYEATKNSHCRESDFNEAPIVEILMQGETGALVALNPENTYGKFALLSGEQCWILFSLMTPQDETGDCPVPVENPLQVPVEKVPVEKDPDKKTCKPSMGEAACNKTGGTWVKGMTEAPHCSCP